MRTFEVTKEPYDNIKIHNVDKLSFEEGLSVLVGCNGCGKTTTLYEIKEDLAAKKIPYMYFDTSTTAFRSSEIAGGNDDFSMVATLLECSEGERMGTVLNRLAVNLREFIISGEPNNYWEGGSALNSVIQLLSGKEKEEITSDERWLLFDALDSGQSIDRLDDFLQLMDLVISDGANQGKTVYVILSANSYELVENQHCIDVYTGNQLSFSSYDEYKQYVLQTAKRVSARY